MKLIDETGHRYGMLTVLKRAPSEKGKRTKWLCRCDCGREVSVAGVELRNGGTKSCGYHYGGKLIDETGNQYGYWKVLERDMQKYKEKDTYWICECTNCGTIKSVNAMNLRNGKTKSCGCVKSSYGEKNIAEALQQLNYKYKKELTYPDLLSPLSSYHLRFDFGVLDENNKVQFLIEYQGEQHFQEVAYFKNTLEEIKIRDNAKKEYCKKHDIPILYILSTHNKPPTVENLIELIEDFWEEIKYNEIFS